MNSTHSAVFDISPQPTTMFPQIPVDVIEDIIDSVQDLDDAKSLRNLALTSHLFLARSRYHLLSWHVRLSSLEKLHSFCDFIDAHPERRLWIKSVTISRTKSSPSFLDYVPVRLLANLPSLFQWRIISPLGYPYGRDLPRRWISSDSPKLRCLQHYTQTITHLHVQNASFLSCADFMRYILAFSSLRHLHYQKVTFEHKDSDTALARARESLSKQLQLSQLTIRDTPGTAIPLLLQSTQRTLQGLVVSVTDNTDLDVKLPVLVSYLPMLSSITLESKIVTLVYANKSVRDDIIQHTVEILEALASNPNSLITRVAVHLRGRNASTLLKFPWDHSDLLRMCPRVETALLRLPRLQTLEFSHNLPLLSRHWTPASSKQYFRKLHERGLIKIKCLAPYVRHSSGTVTALAVSPDGRWIVSGYPDSTLVVWDARYGAHVHEWPAHSDTVKSLAFSRDSRYLVSVGYDRKAMVWDVNTKGAAQRVAVLEGVDICVWPPDETGTTLVAAGDNGTVYVWDPSMDQLRCHALEGHPGDDVRASAVLSPDGRWVASRGAADVCQLWDAATGTLHAVLRLGSVDASAGPFARGFVADAFAGPFARGFAAFDSAGRRVAVAPDDRSVRIYDVETGGELAVLEGHTHVLWNVAFSHDGARVASTWRDGVVRIWDARSGDVLLSFQGHEQWAWAVCFSPDGTRLASTSEDRTVKLWNASDGACVRTFTDHNVAARVVAFSPGGETLVFGGEDGKVYIRPLHDES